MLAPIGALGYLVWVAVALGRWDGFGFMEERGWNSTPSLVGVWHQITAGLTRPLQLGYRVPVYVLFATVALAAVLTVMLWRRRGGGGLPVGAFAWASIVLGLFIGPGYFHAEARFLMPDFPVLLPPAVFLARRDARVAAAVVCGLALLSAWYGGYLLTEWTHSP
ncbi:hypothetical protein KDL01_27415 [Actinospica durhamensis]|uniref:DUF2029 domain-containing protein n=1 Tax=Actinospica durhamensis TaxID=1508375 RepID=A0A941EU26_9ACTN|nr:hypothetical protein [Actinospica durhamensis]MBR7837036.1 hypothetical protein [Actinospica durhamensis]